MKRKNIVFVMNEYNGLGGAQRVTSILAEQFHKDGHNVSLITINELAGEQSYFIKEIPIFLLHKDNYRAPGASSVFSNLKGLHLKRVAREMKRRSQLKKRKQDINKYFDKFGNEEVFVIVIQVWGMQWLNQLIYRPNIKIIGQSHESVKAAKGTHRYKRLLTYYRQVSKFLLLTQKDAEHFEKEGFSNIGVMYNPSPFRQYNEPSELYENKTFVSTGRLVAEKGFDVLIQAFARIAKEIPEWSLHIYGTGPEKNALQSLINLFGMKDRIILKGQTNDIKSVLCSSSIFVLSSFAEGLPMSLIEAQSCGLPCISTDCAPGIREIIEEYRNGLISPVNDVPVLSRHMKRLAQNKELFISYSKDAFENSKKFEKDEIIKQWYGLFDELGGK